MSPPAQPPSRAERARQILRSDLATFVARSFEAINPGETYLPNWHIFALCCALEEVHAGHTRRLLITMPPRYLKSICASVAFPAWVLGKDPAQKIICASYGETLTAKHTRDFRTVVEAPFFARAFPEFGAPKRNTAEEFVTRQNGGRCAVTLGGPVTGLGGNLIIADDLMKASHASSPAERQRVLDFYAQSLVSRLNDKATGAIVVVQQRLDGDDLAGNLIEQNGYTHLNLPAIAPAPQVYDLGRRGRKARAQGEVLFAAREPISVLDTIRADMGAATFSTQYQQDPTAPNDQVLRWHRIVTYEAPVARSACLQLVQSWDTATSEAPTAAFSVCTTWGHDGEAWKLLDVYRARLAFPDLIARARALRDQWRADIILVEDASSGRQLMQSLRRDKSAKGGCLAHVAPLSVDGDKQTRLAAGSALLEDGRARFPVDAPWMPELRRELLAFPGGKFADQVDSISQFLGWAAGRRAEGRLARAEGGRPRGRPRPLGLPRR